MASLQDLIENEMAEHGETFADVVSCTLTDEELIKQFRFCASEEFTLWTHHRVYFPVIYDNESWVGSVSRNPDGKPTAHVGG